MTRPKPLPDRAAARAAKAAPVVGGGLGAAPIVDVDRSGVPRVPGPRGKSLWLGTGAAVASTLFFATNLTLVPLAYDGGANVHAVNLTRQTTVTLFLVLILAVTRRPVRVSPGALRACIPLGVLLCTQFYTLLGTLVFIPVGVAVLLLFTYPFVVAGIVAALGRETLTRLRVGAMVAALSGLALVLQVSGGGLDPRGIGLAIVTATMFGAFVVMAETVMARHGRLSAMFQFSAVSALLTALVALLAGPGLAWPSTHAGWVALAGTSFATALSTVLLFTAISLIGPLRTAIIDCGSPVWTLVLAFLLLGETMTGLQLLGAVLVVGAIVTAQVASAGGR